MPLPETDFVLRLVPRRLGHVAAEPLVAAAWQEGAAGECGREADFVLGHAGHSQFGIAEAHFR